MLENTKLTPWPKELPEWETLNRGEKKLFIKQADVYGAYLAYTADLYDPSNRNGLALRATEELLVDRSRVKIR